MFLVVLAASTADACSPGASFHGFDPWLEGGVGIPTDARIVVRMDVISREVVLTRSDTGDVIPTTPSGWLSVVNEGRVVFVPAEELVPNTIYRADVVEAGSSDPTSTASTTFTTGDGPTDPDVAPPVASGLTGEPWADSDGFLCSIGNPVVARGVSGTVEVPADLPPGSYVALRSNGRRGDFELVEPLGLDTTVAFSFVQGEHASTPDAQRAKRDCMVPLVALPSGQEVEGDETCLEASGLAALGCSTGGVGHRAPAVLLLAPLVGLRRTRRAPDGPAARAIAK
jgi:hypothetical protein